MSETMDPRELARARQVGRRRRTRVTRLRVALATIALTVTIWMLIFAQLVLGRDPALHSTSATAASAASPTSSSTASQVSSSISGQSSDGSSAGNVSPAPVATSTS
jgi:hypothetical protein